MKCWLAHTRPIAAWISAAKGWYCGRRSSSGTCMAVSDRTELTAIAPPDAHPREAAILPRGQRVAVVLAEPFDELAHPDFDGGRRSVANVPHQVVDVGESLRDISRL